jgi:hypothetical protein|tara:strand:- start:1 stop:1137 length:1137 start_codon:yes stop_codon:yes gene_type:complete
MNNPHKNWKEFLINEAGLAKIRQDMSDYDAAFITAFRGDINDKSVCVYAPPSEEELSERDKMGKRGETNKKNNKELSAFLLSQGYGVKNIQGSYIENFGSIDPEKVPREVKEASFFITNLKDDPHFFEEIINLGKRYCQDSVILVPKGKEGYIYGTNKGIYPGLDQKETVGKFAGGQTGEFMSRIKSRPFVMKEDEETKTYEDLPGKQRQSAKLMAQRVDREINEMHMVYNLSEADLPAYDNQGKVKLYHYAPVEGSEIEVDPSQFGKQRYSRREKERSSYPRSFFYVNLDQAESQVKQGKHLFSLDIPTNKLYSIKSDPDGLMKSIRHPTYGFRNDIEWTELFKTIHKNYIGAYYSTPSMDLVVLFEPVTAKKTERE